MAQAITFHSGSPLLGSPLTYAVIPSAHSSNYTFHRTSLVVYAGLEGDADYTDFRFSTPVEGDERVLFDVSSALRAVADRYEYEAAPAFPKRFPYVKFRLEAYDEWMADGQESGQRDRRYYPSQDTYLYAFIGLFSDMERLTAQNTTGRDLAVWTKKPTSVPEIVHVGKSVVRPAYFMAGMGYVQSVNGGAPEVPTEGPLSKEYEISEEGLLAFNPDTDDEFSVYAISAPRNSYEIRFINSLGCMESIHVSAFADIGAKMGSEKLILSRQETFKRFSRGLTVKQPAHEQWKMASGPIDEAWVRWYVHEFLQVRWAWIAINDNYIPCHIIPEDEVTVASKSKGGYLEVPFTVELDIEGSPII